MTDAGRPIPFAVEGESDAAAIRTLFRETGLTAGTAYIAGGKSNLDRRLAGYANAASLAPWLVVRDLDHDADCPIELARRSRRRAIREGLVPDPAGGRKVGPEYASRMIEFAGGPWSPRRAAASNATSSLGRLLNRLDHFHRHGAWR